jgi:hypothetical protein
VPSPRLGINPLHYQERCGSKARSKRVASESMRRLLGRLDAGAHQNLQRLRLLERIDRVVADPYGFEARLVHADANHVIERALHPRFQRNQPLLGRLLAQSLTGRAIDLAHEGRGRNREGVADDARQPLVITVFQRRLAGLDQLEAEACELAALGVIGSRGLSDQGTPFWAKIVSSSSMNAGFNLPLRSPPG